VVRHTGPGGLLVPQIHDAVASVDRNLPVGDVTTLSELIEGSVMDQKLLAQLSALFAMLAAFLAYIGLYGVMSYGIARRTNEFGVRMALGAARRDVLWIVLRDAIQLVGIGIAAGLVLFAGAGRMIRSVLYETAPSDPWALTAATAGMIIVAVVAGYLPARKATRIEPIRALRYE
jgi:ABC-type antimicrobial peptide transport system permease subunit